MIGQPEILVFLCTPDYLSYYEKNGLVLTSSAPAPLIFTPDGWEEYSISVVRNSKYWAIDRSFSIPWKFVEDGALILKDRAYKYGTEDKVMMVILRRDVYFDATHYGLYYRHLYKGEVDLSQMKHQGAVVTANIMEGGIPKAIKANENTKYEFPMNVPEAIYVKHTGVKLHTKVTFSTFSDQFITSSDGTSGDPSNVDGYLMTFNELSREGNPLGVQIQSVPGEPEGSSVDYAADTRWFIRANQAVTLSFDFNFRFQISKLGAGSGRCRIELVKGPPSSGPIIHSFYDSPVAPGSTIVDVNQPVTVNLIEDERLFIRITLHSDSGTGNPLNIITFKSVEQQSTLNYDFIYRDTFVRYFTLKYLLDQLTSKMTDGQYSAVSTLLDDINAKFGPTLGSLLVTCGDALRGFDDAILKTSWSDFFTSVNAVLCIGAGAVQNKLKLETKDAWVDYANPLIVGNAAPTPTYSPATDYHFNTWKFGYQNVSIEDVNGRYAFNNTQIYGGPYTRQQKEYNAVSVYHADPYLIEDTRINFEGKTTTDSETDTNNFFAAVLYIPSIDTVNGKDAFVYELDRRLNPYITTGSHPEKDTIFNVPISPKHNLYRHGRFIRSCHYKLDHKKLAFQTTDKWRAMEVRKPGQRPVDEDADVEIGSLGDQFFIPWLIDIEVESPADLIDTLEITPVKTVQYNDNNLSLAGLIIKAGIEPSTNDAQAYQLLSSPNNVITDLVNVFE
jgi:hypothetical protein